MKKTAVVLMIFLFRVLGSVYAQAPARPTLPQLTVNLTLPTQGTSTCPTLTTGSNCIRNVPSGDATNLQNAINAATCGDTIVLVAGSTYSGNFTIPQTTCTNNSGWIEIQSSAMGSLPGPGNRVGASNVSNMPIISTPNSSPAIFFEPYSKHWRVMGVAIETSYASSGNAVYEMVSMGLQSDGSSPITNPAQFPIDIVFDRVYVYGATASGVSTEEGFRADASGFALVDSYCDNIVYSSEDAQCVAIIQGPGPFLIQNNFLQASGENIMSGGADPAIANAVPSDFTIIGNLIQKNVAWMGVISDIKNLFELKNAQRVLLDGNVLQYTWEAGQDEAIILRSVNQSGSCTWCVVQDVTVTHNLIQHMPIGIILASDDCPSADCVATGRILISNNVLRDSNSASWGGHGWVFELGFDPALIMHDITIDHNTSFGNDAYMYLGDSGTANNVQITNSISDYGSGGIIGNGAGAGTLPVTTFLTNYVYNQMVFPTTSTGTYPTGTLWAGSLAGVGFTSYSGTDPDLSGSFQLTSGSASHNAGTDGKDIGVWDWICLNNDTAAALAGTFTPSPGCAMPGNLLIQPPTHLTATVQ